MFDAYVPGASGLEKGDTSGGVPDGAVWVDLVYPSVDEEHQVEQALGVDIPTREEMQEIEISSRLYTEGNVTFLTASLMSRSESEDPEIQPVTFVLTSDRLVTVRYSEPKSFQAFISRVLRRKTNDNTADELLAGLLEAVVDRTADILESASSGVESLSHEIFTNHSGKPRRTRDFQSVLERVGHVGDLNSKVRESLVSIGRLLTFLLQRFDVRQTGRSTRYRVKTLTRDIHSLTDHASFMSNKIGFLLDATLGMINIEQNAIIKIFSIAAVVFLPPTLVASIYGMNFRLMPELDWPLGYPLALVLMVMSAILPCLYFKRRGWL